MTDDMKKTLLPVSAPWLAHYFKAAHTLFDELEKAASFSDFAPECLNDQELASFADRLLHLFCTLPREDGESVQPPLETEVLGQAIFMLYQFLQHEAFLREDNPAYATYCNEVKVDREAHNGQWPAQKEAS